MPLPQMPRRKLPQMPMIRRGPAPKAKPRARKVRVERKPETAADMQVRLQKAVDHGWRPTRDLPEGVTLVIPDA
jgi:hypothetical protein